MELETIIELIKTVSDSTLTEFSYQKDDLNITMKTEKGNTVITTASDHAGMIYPPISEMQTMNQTSLPRVTGEAKGKSEGNTIYSPLVGTFYASSSPDASPYVKVGDTVKKGQTLGIIEAMKLMNEIESECDGTIVSILIENEQVVEYGQALFVIQSLCNPNSL